MGEEKKKKSLFDRAVDALTDRDEKEAAAKVAAEKAAAEKAAADRMKAAQDEAERAKARVAYEKAVEERKAAEKAEADRVAAKAAADQAAKERAEAVAKANADQAKLRAEQATSQRLESLRAAQPKKGTVNVRSLRIRKEHNTTSEMVGGLVAGNEVTIYETWTDGKDTWARIGDDQWAAMVYEGETYIRLND